MSSSYSALLRRSKLASFNPSIEQVYSSSGGNLSRSNFGLKRPLPQATTAAAPFVRVDNLDNPQKRTQFRKGTKEALFVRKWAEQGIQVTSTADQTFRPAEYTTAVQSRFVPRGFGGGVPEPAEAVEEARTLAGRPPNFLELSEHQFEEWLEGLTTRRDQFAAFVQQRINSSEPVSLYEFAQGSGVDLVRALEAFLAATSPNPLLSSKLVAYPHRTLGLQYNTITPLESSFAPPVPGRLLGLRGASPFERGSRVHNVASVLGQVGALPETASAGIQPTNWFPDAAGVRNNAAGRAQFKVRAQVHPSAFATRVALAAQRGRKPFQPKVPAGIEAAALAEQVLSLHLDAVSPGTAAPRLPGTREYSGELPPAKRRFSNFDASDLFDRSLLAGKGEPRNLSGRPSFASNQVRKTRNARLAAQRRKEGKQLAGAAGNTKARNESILESLESLLDLNLTDKK